MDEVKGWHPVDPRRALLCPSGLTEHWLNAFGRSSATMQGNRCTSAWVRSFQTRLKPISQPFPGRWSVATESPARTRAVIPSTVDRHQTGTDHMTEPLQQQPDPAGQDKDEPALASVTRPWYRRPVPLLVISGIITLPLFGIGFLFFISAAILAYLENRKTNRQSAPVPVSATDAAKKPLSRGQMGCGIIGVVVLVIIFGAALSGSPPIPSEATEPKVVAVAPSKTAVSATGQPPLAATVTDFRREIPLLSRRDPERGEKNGEVRWSWKKLSLGTSPNWLTLYDRSGDGTIDFAYLAVIYEADRLDIHLESSALALKVISVASGEKIDAGLFSDWLLEVMKSGSGKRTFGNVLVEAGVLRVDKSAMMLFSLNEPEDRK